jgi:hypothetical protein
MSETVGQNESVEDRAHLIARMMPLIIHGLKTKTYEEFVESFSNPDGKPDHRNRELSFQMRMSPTCWYNATANYRHAEPPSVRIHGDGDDLGVFIFITSDRDPIVHFRLEIGERAGTDASAVVRTLRTMPGWSS